MSKFKIGDKVRLVDNTTCSCNEIGDVGVVTEVDCETFKVQVEGNNDIGNWSAEDDLELVEDSEVKVKYNESKLRIIETNKFTVTRINDTHILIEADSNSIEIKLDEVDELCNILQQLKGNDETK